MCVPGRAISPGASAPTGPVAASENRGAGAGWATPPDSVNVPRAARWGWRGASDIGSTGATHASVPLKSFVHSS